MYGLNQDRRWDENSKFIQLFSPLGTKNPYYLETGWKELTKNPNNIDLPNLPKKRAATFFPLSWVLYSLYLSEKIGYNFQY